MSGHSHAAQRDISFRAGSQVMLHKKHSV